MAIENIQQLRDYLSSQPWYKKIFFPRTLRTVLGTPSVSEPEIRMIYTKVRSSWLWRFHNWLFPDLGSLPQVPSTIPMPERLHAGPHPNENRQTSIENGIALIAAIRFRDNERINQITDLPPDQRPDAESLIDALRYSIRATYTTYALLKADVYDTSIVSRAFLLAINAQEWDSIPAFTRFKFLCERLDTATCNNVVLLTARAYKTYELSELLGCKEIADKISTATICQVLFDIMVPIQYEHDSDAALVQDILHFKDINGVELDINSIQTAYIKAIELGRVKTLMILHAALGTTQLPIESIIQALKVAAQNRHYEMVLHLIQSIPQERRFEVLQIKSLINVESTFRARVELDKTHILQWAACRHAPKDLRTILDALVNEQERYTLITQTIWNPDINHFYPQYFSPLMLATANIRMDNLIMMLNSLTHEHVIDAILPKKVSYFTPLYSHLHCLDTQRYIMPIFLEKLFGENQKLYGAYHYLKARNDWKTLKALRDHYLASHFPTPTQRHLGFFRFDFSIPGHPLSKEELDLVVRVRFYQRYYELDDIERGKIQAQMNAYDPPEGARVESRLTLSQF